MPATIKKSAELTLKDRLSRLTFIQACKILGSEGKRWLTQGGKFEIILNEHVFLGNDLFRLTLPDAIVTITLMASARDRLHWNCTACSQLCEHVGAAFSLILEDKMALGLAAPPPERKPVESLNEDELVHVAIEERRERAKTEGMKLRAVNGHGPWTDYTLTSTSSGKSYRVALRGFQRGDSYCSCPDYRKNTLGTCKHILYSLNRVKRMFPPAQYNQRYVRKNISVNLRYGEQTELRLLLPENLDAKSEAIVAPLRDRAIADPHDLLKRLRELEALGRDVHIYPDAEEYIQQRLLLEKLQQTSRAIRKDVRNHPLRKELLKTELLPYQLDGIAFAVGAGRAVLADDMGLGKTIQGIGVAELLAREAGISRVLVVCPASLKSQWRLEIQRFSNRECQLVFGGMKERVHQYEKGTFFTVCNYEQVLRDIMAIERVKWDLIILDEGQRIKNWEAKTTRVMKGLRSPFALVLSGTPLENRLDELFSVVEFIDERRLGPAFRFYNRHRVADEKGKVLGYKNLDELREKLKPVLLRRTRASVMQDLPPRTTEIIRIEPTEEQLNLHGEHMRIVSSIVKKKYISEMDLLRLQKALLMCRMAADSTFLLDKKPPGYSSKLEELDERLESLFQEKGRKIVLFSEWTTMLNLIEKILNRRKLQFVRLDGSVPQTKRHQLVHEFQNNPKCQLFITTNAGSTGLNLQAANTVINVDLPWNPAILEQRIARAHRMGQKNPVQVYVLVTERTIEENLLATLAAKHELALAALDPDSDVSAVDMVSGIEDLKRRMELLLGARPPAPVDASNKENVEETTRLAERRNRISSAGGQLLSSAFTFLNELLPQKEETEEAKRLAAQLKSRFDECLARDEQGQVKLTVTLPDENSLDGLVQSLARLLAANGNEDLRQARLG